MSTSSKAPNGSSKIRTTLSLDLGMDLGYSIFDGIKENHGYCEFKAQHEGDSYFLYLNWLKATISKHNVNDILFEEVEGIWKNKYAQRYYFGFRAVTSMAAYYFGCKMIGYNQITAKTKVIGNFRADKVDIMTHFRNRGFDVTTDDEADALMISHLHQMVLSGEVDLTKPKKKKKR